MTRDPWAYYWSDCLDASTPYWSAARFISLLDSDSLEGMTVLDVDQKDRCVQVEIEGLCYDSLGCAVYDAYAKDMTDEQRTHLMLMIRRFYPEDRDPRSKTKRESARALRCWRKA